jgi:hypothetical protein
MQGVFGVGIHGKNFAGLLGQIADGVDEALGKKSFSVVLYNHGIDLGEEPFELLEGYCSMFGEKGCGFFAVDADHMLLAGYDPRFYDGLVMGVRLEGVGADSPLSEKAAQVLRVLALARDAHDVDLLSKFAEVSRNICGTAREVGVAGHLHHRNRRLWRDAGDFAPNKLIQDQVSDDEDAFLCKVGEEKAEIRAFHRRLLENGNRVEKVEEKRRGKVVVAEGAQFAKVSVTAAKSNGIIISWCPTI